MKEKLVVAIMGQDCEKFIGMCLESVKDADAIVYCDGGSTDKTVELVGKINPNVEYIFNKFDQENPKMNGRQRNFYLDYVKKNYPDWWCLVIDADEVVDDLSKLKRFINSSPQKELISIKMRHFENTLGFEDAILPKHYVPNRLFKVKGELFYPEVEHSVLWIKKNNKLLSEEELVKKHCGGYDGVTIWHLSYCSGVWEFKKKYLNNLKKSNMHTKEYLDDWYFSHLFGTHKTSPIKLEDIPHIILKELLIDPDKIYFMNHKTLEAKHFFMSRQWIGYFQPKTVIELGCGLGMYGHALTSYGIDYQGLEISKWAVENTVFKYLKIKQGDITEKQDFKDFDLVLCVDILEHLEEKDLDKTLEYIKEYGKNFLFSIPWIGNINLEEDPTHKIKKEKQWWINKLTNHFKIRDTPNNFMYKEQMLIGEPK